MNDKSNLFILSFFLSSLSRNRTNIDIQSSLTKPCDIEPDITIIFDVVRSGPRYENYWLLRSDDEASSRFDLALKFRTAVNQKRFKPIPEISLPTEHNIIDDEWYKTVVDGTPLCALKTRKGIPPAPFQLSLVLLQDRWNPFLRSMETIHERLVRAIYLDHQNEVKDYQLKLDETKKELEKSSEKLQKQDELKKSNLELKTKLSDTLDKCAQARRKLSDEYDYSTELKDEIHNLKRKLESLERSPQRDQPAESGSRGAPKGGPPVAKKPKLNTAPEKSDPRSTKLERKLASQSAFIEKLKLEKKALLENRTKQSPRGKSFRPPAPAPRPLAMSPVPSTSTATEEHIAALVAKTVQAQMVELNLQRRQQDLDRREELLRERDWKLNHQGSSFQRRGDFQ